MHFAAGVSLTAEDGSVPLAVPANDGVDLGAWLEMERSAVESALYRHGAILFRGFDVDMPGGFGRVAAAAADLIEYLYRSTPRTSIAPKIYSSTEYPADQSIPPHCEAAYQRDWPMKLLFGCETPPASGGRTPLSDMVRVTAAIDPSIRRAFGDRGVLYVRNYGGGSDLPWQTVFQTDDRSAVDSFCASEGIETTWRADGTLVTRQVCQGMATHPVTGQSVWFNQAHLFHISALDSEVQEALLDVYGEERLPRNAYYGDGAPIEGGVLAHVRAAFAGVSASFEWRRGDVLLVDNMLAAHAREPYTGPRRILAAMGDRYSAVASRLAVAR